MVSFLALMLGFGWLSAQNNAPAGFPTNSRPADGNVDAAGYDAAKAEWVATHPAEYNALIEGKTTKVNTETNRTEFATEAEKDKWVEKNPALYQEALKPIESKTTYTREELKQLPLDKQQSILNDSNFTIID